MDKKKLKCSKCGNDDLNFINVPYSVKGDAGIITVLQIACAGIIILLLIVSLFILNGLSVDDLSFNLKIFSFVFIIPTLICTAIILILQIAKYYIPYKNKNVIEYVCPVCGNNEALKNLIDKTDSDSLPF